MRSIVRGCSYGSYGSCRISCVLTVDSLITEVLKYTLTVQLRHERDLLDDAHMRACDFECEQRQQEQRHQVYVTTPTTSVAGVIDSPIDDGVRTRGVARLRATAVDLFVYDVVALAYATDGNASVDSRGVARLRGTARRGDEAAASGEVASYAISSDSAEVVEGSRG